MKKNVYASLRFWMMLLVLISIAAIQNACAANPPLEGRWKGKLKVPGGELEIVFRLVSLTSGGYFAALDVPQQRIGNLMVQVAMQGDTVMFLAEDADSRFKGKLASDGHQLQGTWKQPGYTAPLILQYVPLLVSPKTARLTPPYREEEVTYSNTPANLKLGGTLTVPAGPGPFPAVVLMSDAGAHDRDGSLGDYHPLGSLADYLTRRGIAVLRFDDRGIGQSGGKPASSTTTELVTDVQAGISFLKSRPDIQATHIGVIGHGEGGNVALLTAAQSQEASFVVTLAAHGVSGSDLVYQQQVTMLHSLGMYNEQVQTSVRNEQELLSIVRHTPDDERARSIIVSVLQKQDGSIDEIAALARAAQLTTPQYRAFLSFDPLAQLPAVKCPVLLLNGTADHYTTADTNINALSKGLKTNPNVTAYKLPKVNHLFQSDPDDWPVVNGQRKETFSPEAKEIIREWIMKQVQ
ncbi:alpha/beta hydrolase family protein [Hymenobacter sp. GOD-10R]|uniref:alpha/beta hydrolase family protein n=1 Tax=Hymenobacter sp. GOD-10R TaxID=3093922 RepID=UPI002D7864E9|nr:alpha/beta fold hydrolase [Hymenobacter sp. GOD-10R]WRQ27868.1 alpha/beta fold hydrolase [Hymenobacter sp. GOD-10R]